MIFTERQITIRNGKSSINEPVILYRGDYEVSIRFTIMESKYRFKSGVNLVESEKASYAQLALLAPDGTNVFTEIGRCEDGTAIFVLSNEMIDELSEVGLYSFQIRLFDYYRESRITIPPVEFGIEVREPIAAEDHTNAVDDSMVGYSIAKTSILDEPVPDTFNASGQYNKTDWETGDRISEGKLNKIEDALEQINQNELNDAATLDKRITNNFNVLKSQLEHKADDNDLNILKNRVDNLTSLPEGSTIGDAELLDARVGSTGIVYNNTGDAIRSQFDKLNNLLIHDIHKTCNEWSTSYVNRTSLEIGYSNLTYLSEPFYASTGDIVRSKNKEYEFKIAKCDSEGTPLSIDNVYYDEQILKTNGYIRIQVHRTDSGTITINPNDGEYLDIILSDCVSNKNGSVTTDKLSDNCVTEPKTTFFNHTPKSLNLHNLETDVKNMSISPTGVINSSSTDYKTTDFIEVGEKMRVACTCLYNGETIGAFTYNRNTALRVVCYDKNKNFISAPTLFQSLYINTPENTAFIRVVLGMKSQNVMIYLGDQIKNYVKYEEEKYLLKSEYIDNDYIKALIDKNTNDATESDNRYIISNKVFDDYKTTSEYVKFIEGRGHLATIYNLWDTLAADNSNYITKTILGIDSGGYEINMYKFAPPSSDMLPNVDNFTSRKIVYVSCIHGNEPNAPLDDFRFFKELVDNHNSNNVLSMLYDNVEFIVVPIACPWAYENSSRTNANGVNINRNFPVNWHAIEEGSNYSGPSAGSEIETKLIMSLIDENQDGFFINRHGTDTFTNAGIYGYIASNKKQVRSTCYGVFRKLDRIFKNEFDWITSDNPNNSSRNIFGVRANSDFGNMDNYIDQKGMPCILLELGNKTLGSKYPNGTREDCQIMNVETIGNMISSIINNL